MQKKNICLSDWVKDCIRGCLMAGAAGDALGYPVEFMSSVEIRSHYGPRGITGFELDGNGKALVSDDTQMSLFTANGLLMGLTRAEMRGIGMAPEKYVKYAYTDWYYTQTGKLRADESPERSSYTWLRNLPELAHRRAPGVTCLDACARLLRNDQPQNDSKGCGGIMRVAPMGLLNAAYRAKGSGGGYEAERLAEAGAEIARCTHLHPLGFLPAALLVLLIDRLVPLSPDEVKAEIGVLIEEGLAVMMAMEGKKYANEKEALKKLTQKAVELAASDVADQKAIRELGEGWTGEEAWAVSLFCALRHIDSVKEAVIAAVNHDGDSDSTGSITGNIMGAIHGYEAIRSERLFCPEGKAFEETIELSDIILALADDLFTGCIIYDGLVRETPEQKQWFARYCEMKAE